jgi:hypothetical protein
MTSTEELWLVSDFPNVPERREPKASVEGSDKKLWVAWLQFVGIIVGVVFGTLLVLVFVAMAADIEGGVLGRAAIPIVVVGLLLPTWRYAKAVIGRPMPKGNPRRPLKEYPLASAPISGPEKFGRWLLWLTLQVPVAALNVWPLLVVGYVLAVNGWDSAPIFAMLIWILWIYPFYHIMNGAGSVGLVQPDGPNFPLAGLDATEELSATDVPVCTGTRPLGKPLARHPGSGVRAPQVSADSAPHQKATLMSISMYQASVPAFLQMLNSLSAILEKAEADAAERKIDPAVLLQYRLAPDMFPLIRQVQIATDHAKGCCARLAGVDVPKYADDETTFADLTARNARTVEFVRGFRAEQIDGSEGRDITITAGSRQLQFKGQQYLLHFALPNFYFHTTTAYAILRHCGVQIGKRDFLGAL